MSSTVWRNFRQAPFRYSWLVFKKLFIYPLQYKTGDGYDAEKYWHLRLSKYGTGLQGVGEEGRTEADNEARYHRVCGIFKEVCREVVTDPAASRVLEIGVGTGRMTEVLYELGIQHYLGVDITEALFPSLTEKFAGRDFHFSRANIVQDPVEGMFDLIVIIDVIEHIVEDHHFTSAMDHLKACLNPGGTIIIAPIVAKNRRIQFYERHWDQSDLDKNFAGYRITSAREWEPGFSDIKVLQSI